MTRLRILLVAACLVPLTLPSGRAEAQPSRIAVAMGDLRWGFTESEVIAYLHRKLDEQYASQLEKTHDTAKQTRLREEKKRRKAEVRKSLVSFVRDGSRWDGSVVAGEFSYGNGESMLVHEDGVSEDYYFFLNGRLWKWYKAYAPRVFGGSNFKKFSQSVQKKFGKGRVKTGELTPGSGDTKWLEYLDRNSRLRAADNTKRGAYALIFEELSTVRSLASLRSTSPARKKSLDEERNERGRTELTRAPAKRSLFAEESRGESDAEYRERQQRERQEDRQRQERMYVRTEDQKKGEALKTLDGLDEKDPLGGL